jgi:hypothetical protein
MGEEYAGKLLRDGWAPYRQFTQADHQTCLGHLLRDVTGCSRPLSISSQNLPKKSLEQDGNGRKR